MATQSTWGGRVPKPTERPGISFLHQFQNKAYMFYRFILDRCYTVDDMLSLSQCSMPNDFTFSGPLLYEETGIRGGDVILHPSPLWTSKKWSFLFLSFPFLSFPFLSFPLSTFSSGSSLSRFVYH